MQIEQYYAGALVLTNGFQIVWQGILQCLSELRVLLEFTIL